MAQRRRVSRCRWNPCSPGHNLYHQHEGGKRNRPVSGNKVRIVQHFDNLRNLLISREVPTFSLWSDTSPVLIVGTNRGNVFFLNVLTSRCLPLYECSKRYKIVFRKTPIMGKHQRSITSGAFNEKGLLALGSEDATITISNGTLIFRVYRKSSLLSCNCDKKFLRVIFIKA